MTEIDECRLAVMSAYIRIARLKSLDPVEMDRIRDLQLRMEAVQNGFDKIAGSKGERKLPALAVGGGSSN